MGPILLSVIALCYNHEKYLEQSIQGVVSQKVNFRFEYIIHDDASTDSSRSIIERYAKLYPNLIIPIFQTVNQYSLGVPIMFNLMRYSAHGKYIALCECDDYWTNPAKLECQVNYLESHILIGGCAHRSLIVDENGKYKCRNFKENFYIYKKKRLYTLSEFEKGFQPGQTATWVFRRKLILGHSQDDFQKISSVKSTGDTKIAALLAAQGGIHCMDEVMSCYRLVTNNGTSWNARIKDENMSKFFYDSNKGIANLLFVVYGQKVNLCYINSGLLLAALRQYIVNTKSSANREILQYIWQDMPHKVITSVLALTKALLLIPKTMVKMMMQQ